MAAALLCSQTKVKLRYYIPILIFLLALSSCERTDSYSNPDELIVCLSVSEDYDKTVNKVEAFHSYLEKSLGMKVKIFKVTNGSAVVEAMKAKKIHLGSTGAFSYMVAKSKIDIRPLVTSASVSTDTIHQYWSCLIVPKDSPIKNLDDLINQKNKLTLAWSYPTSTSGHLVPRDFLSKIGIEQEDFKDVMVSESHVASLYNCISGKIDVAAVNNTTLSTYLKRGKISREDYRIIWESEPIPRGAIFVSSDLNDQLANKIQKALTDLDDIDPEASQKIHYQYEYPIKYVSIDDSYYDSLRMMAKNTGLL